MAVFRCKMCGGELPPVTDSVVECEYCGSRQTIPSADNEKKVNKFVRANRMRLVGEFDMAAKVYESIVEDFPEEAEAYWGMVLCRYGIEYVDDPVAIKKIPTCHRSSYSSIFSDVDYLQALELADPAARKVYRQEAECIETLRENILAVAAKEKPYDIFICYKDKDRYGKRTCDSVLAQDLYGTLTSAGYRVFFSRISLEDKLGQEYEPYIFAALNSAKVMLAVGTNYEYFDAVWVKNEWSRFLKMMQKDRTKHLIPCFRDIDPYDMPHEFHRLQAQDLGKIGAHQDLLRGIEKLIGTRTHDISNPQVDDMVSSGFWNINNRDRTAARSIFLSVLSNDPANADACLGMMLCGTDEEKILYGRQFQTLAGTEPSRIETEQWDKLFDEILMYYHELGLLNRVRKALMATGKIPAQETLLSLHQKWSSDQMIHKLARDKSSNLLSGSIRWCSRSESLSHNSYRDLQLVLAYAIHKADAHLGMAVCGPADERAAHLRQFREHMTEELSTFEQEALAHTYPDEFISCYMELGLWERAVRATAYVKSGLKSSTVYEIRNHCPDAPQIRKLLDNQIHRVLTCAFEKLFSYKSMRDANTLFTEILNEDPTNADALLGMALCTSQDEKKSYLARFREHAGAEPSQVERAFWKKCGDKNESYEYSKLLLGYAAAGQHRRIYQALEACNLSVPEETLFELVKEYPDIQLVEALEKNGTNLDVWQRIELNDPTLKEGDYNLNSESRSFTWLLLTEAKKAGKDICSIAEYMLDRFPEAANGRKYSVRLEDYSQSLLEEAIFEWDDLALAEMLLARGEKADAVCVFYDCQQHIKTMVSVYKCAEYTLAEAAAEYGKYQFLPLLVKYGAKVRNSFFANLFLKNGDALPDREMAQAYLDCGCDINAEMPMVTRANCLGFASSRIFYNYDITIQAPLLYALIQMNRPASHIQMLLELGADADRRAHVEFESVDHSLTVADCCIRFSQDPRVLELLLDHGADPDATSTTLNHDRQFCDIPLIFRAIEEHRPEMVAVLLKHGVDVNVRFSDPDKYNSCQTTAVIECINFFYGPHEEKSPLKLLLEHGADVNAPCVSLSRQGHYYEIPPLNCAIKSNRYESVSLLLAHGADLKAGTIERNAEGENLILPLNEAVMRAKDIRIVKLLLEHGADPNTRHIELGRSATYIDNVLLYCAYRADREDMMRLLLKYGADTSILHETKKKNGDSTRESVLHRAVCARSMSMVRLLIEHGCSLDLVTTLDGVDYPFRKYPYDLNDEWMAFLRQIGWKGPNFFDRMKMKKMH